jgi:citrate lyase subunit alpha/citrate CoA-transferase
LAPQILPPDLGSSRAEAGMKVVPIARLRELARSEAKSQGECECGGNAASNVGKRIVAVQQYRDGSVIDVVRQVPERWS